MIRSSTLARARALVGRSLRDSCVIERAGAGGRGAFGEVTGGDEVVARGVSCRLIRANNAKTGAVGLSGDRALMRQEYMLVLAWGSVLAEDYVVTVGGVRYLVVRVSDTLTDAVDVRAVLVTADE